MKLETKATLTLLALLAWGCHSSTSSIDGAADAADSGTDGTADSGTDPGTDPGTDTATDTLLDTTDAPPTGYALHEWGVMVTGPGGAVMHGPTPEYTGAIPAKPVIYLYADEAFDLDLAVTFASGGPTETWPEIPHESTLVWSGLEVAPGACEATPFPSPWEDPMEEGYCEACTLGMVVVDDASCITHGSTVGRLLFYTGTLPDYESPLQVEWGMYTDPTGGSSIGWDVWVDGPDPVEDVWLVYRQTTDSCIDPSACPVVTADIAWYHLDSVEPGETLSFTTTVQHFEAEVDEYGWPIPGTMGLPAEWEGLGDDLHAVLVERGLTEAESSAFMNAWDTIFFGLMGSDVGFVEPLYANGAAAISFMSREDYDEQLALETSAPPDEIVRVGLVYENLF